MTPSLLSPIHLLNECVGHCVCMECLRGDPREPREKPICLSLPGIPSHPEFLHSPPPIPWGPHSFLGLLPFYNHSLMKSILYPPHHQTQLKFQTDRKLFAISRVGGRHTETALLLGWMAGSVQEVCGSAKRHCLRDPRAKRPSNRVACSPSPPPPPEFWRFLEGKWVIVGGGGPCGLAKQAQCLWGPGKVGWGGNR